MGYSCPVCTDPQADAEHLANHLAITALTRGGDHEAWLDEAVPDWETLGEAELAEHVAERATETEYPKMFEDTTGDEHSHGQPESGDSQSLPPGADLLTGDLDEDTEGVIREAMEMTRTQRSQSDAAEDSQSTEHSGADSE